MKILVEGEPLFGPRTGVGQYVKHLLEATFDLDHTNRYTIYGYLFLGRRMRWQGLPTGRNVRYRFVRYLPGQVYNRLRKHVVSLPVDVMMGQRYDLAVFTNFKRHSLALTQRSVTIVYDLSFTLPGQYTEARNLRDLTNTVGASVQRSTQVITISESAKSEIIHQYGLPADKVSVVTPAVDHASFYPRPAPEVAEIRQRYALPQSYILYTGTLEPRKNIISIIEAYEHLPAKLRNSHALVLAGGKGWRDEAIKAKIQQAAQHHHIITPGYIPDEQLPALYTGASLFVFPSHYEGFGMPPLEAMACGVPVITANNSSLPEVVGDAAVLIEASDVSMLTTKMEQILTTPATAQRLRAAGLKRAQHYSWQASAQQFLDALTLAATR